MEDTVTQEVPGAADLFKHENDSVDLLLKQINQGKNLTHISLNHNDSPNVSPTKPLQFSSQETPAEPQAQKSITFPNTPTSPVDPQLKRDFNSSSDTYVSDASNAEVIQENPHAAEPANHQQEINENAPREDARTDNDSTDAASAINTNDPHASPSKSIMRTKVSAESPKKSVAFQPSLDTFHTYSPREPDSTTPTDSATPVNHSWSEVDRSVSPSDITASPPMPPPHTSNTITGLLTSDHGSHPEDNSELDPPKLAAYKSSEQKYNSIPLSEKLNVFLDNNSHANDDLDEHLLKLNLATKEETDANIHHLSYSMESHIPRTENPLNALSKSSELYINSAHSSQSSLQSLVDSNRQLQADVIDKTSRGIQLNDGIKGFTDSEANRLIQFAAEDDEPFSEASDISSHLSFNQNRDQPNVYTDNSFDQSYRSTEKSILTLLHSASQLELVGGLPATHDQSDAAVKPEPEFPDSQNNNNVLPSASSEHQPRSAEDPITVKQEPTDAIVKSESETSSSALQTPGHDTPTQLPTEKEYTSNTNSREDYGQNVSASHMFFANFEDDNFVTQSSITSKVKLEDETSSPILHEQNNKPDTTVKIEPMPQEGMVKEENNIDTISTYSQTNDTEYEQSGNVSFEIADPQLQEAQEHSMNVRTYQVDEKAVVPGDVKLVHSVQNSAIEPAPLVKIESKDNTVSSSDQDDENLPRVKLETEHHKSATYTSSTDSVNSEEYKDSVEYTVKSLAPRQHDRMKAVSFAPQESSKESMTTDKLTEEQIAEGSDTITSQEHENSILANSSNINPPIDINLPMIDSSTNDFADLTDRLNDGASSFEESLSAEHDVEKKSLDFLSIWHSQSLGHRHARKPAPAFYKVPSISTYNTADLSQCGKYHIPRSLQPKRFTDVNLVSAKVVNSNYENLNVSGFLPELSQDSGIESHFRGIIKDGSTMDGAWTLKSDHFRRKSFDSSNILSEIDNPNGAGTSLRGLRERRRRRSVHDTFRISIQDVAAQHDSELMKKKSKFHVPSFEIKRSDSLLSPKNQYNEIFSDAPLAEPTIKAPGMKTLPSMDREDVKKIMEMKKAMSQEEYSNLKKVGISLKSNVHEVHPDKVDLLSQRASIYCDSLVSNRGNRNATEPTPKLSMTNNERKEAQNANDWSSHVWSELFHEPVVIPDKEPYFKNQVQSSVVKEAETQKPSEPNQKFEIVSFPEPDPELISLSTGSPKHDKIQKVVKVPTNATLSARKLLSNNPFRNEMSPTVQEDTNKPRQEGTTNYVRFPAGEVHHKFSVKTRSEFVPESKTASTTEVEGDKSVRSSPIKISSPVKLVKQNGSVTGIVLDKRKDDANDTLQLHNKKIRTEKTQLGTVSVPSNIMSETSSGAQTLKDAMNDPSSTDVKTTNEPQVSKTPTSKIHLSNLTSNERGKLFFRVVSMKNLSLPDLKERNIAFNITLDNAIHCIKTPNYNVETKDVKIDKEFELSVAESLQFILTMKATYSSPKLGYKEIKERKVIKSKKKLGRLFGSKEVITTTKFVPHEVNDVFDSLLATDGSFSRAYVDLSQYEDQITGQSRCFSLTCFNEWATYIHNGEKVLKKPYPIAQLEVKMLYIPRSESYEILPASIKAAYESIEDLKKESSLSVEGYLHQEGGDCEMWKRRWFKLSGTSMIAHSEYSHKTRAKINLAKVAEVIYVDKENMIQSSTNYRNFSDILLMENAFKIRFANGEIIDFGAPTKTEKLMWIKAIQEIVYRNKFRRQPWVKMMQEKNRTRRSSSVVT